MSCNSKFSKIAQKTINKYFQEFSGSLQNTFLSKALECREKVEKLRINFLNYLGLSSSFLISFQPNKYYQEKVIINFLNSRKERWHIFTNRKEIEFKNSIIFSLEEFLKLEKLTNYSFIYVDEQSININLLEKLIQKFKFFQNKSALLYSFLITKKLDCLKALNSRLNNFSFISYDLEEDLEEFGTTFFLFKKELNLKPLFLGSGGVKFDHERQDIKLQELPHLLEIGTQNLVSLLVLSNYFEYLMGKSKHSLLNSIEDVQ